MNLPTTLVHELRTLDQQITKNTDPELHKDLTAQFLRKFGELDTLLAANGMLPNQWITKENQAPTSLNR